VGRDGGYTAKVADACVVVPTVNAAHVTPHTEAFQAVVWHLFGFASQAESSQHQVGRPAMTERAALFLDRDGVVCRALVRSGKPFPARSLQELDILPGVKEALQKAGAQKLIRIIVTNQPDVARGTLAREVVEAMHDRLRSELEIDDVLVCWHDDADGCACRKPKPGLLLEGAERHGVDMAKSSWLGTGGGTWRPARGPGVVLSGLTAATMNKARPQRRTTGVTAWPRPWSG